MWIRDRHESDGQRVSRVAGKQPVRPRRACLQLNGVQGSAAAPIELGPAAHPVGGWVRGDSPIHFSTDWLICSTPDFGNIRCNSHYNSLYLSL